MPGHEECSGRKRAAACASGRVRLEHRVHEYLGAPVEERSAWIHRGLEPSDLVVRRQFRRTICRASGQPTCLKRTPPCALPDAQYAFTVLARSPVPEAGSDSLE